MSVPPLISFEALFPDREGTCRSLFIAASRYVEGAAAGRPPTTTTTGTGVLAASNPEIADGLRTLAALPDETFFAVVARHTALPRIMRSILDDSAGLRSVAMDPSVSDALVHIISRLCNTLGTSSSRRLPNIDPSTFAGRLAALLPAEVLLPIAVCLYRKNDGFDAVTLTGLVLQSPAVLGHLRPVGLTWCSDVRVLHTNTLDQARLGRLKRRPADIIVLVERSHRYCCQMWSMLRSCPFLVPFLPPADRLLHALRILADTVAPLVQHFCITSNVLLAERRDVLCRTLAFTVNAAIDAALYVILFTTVQGNTLRPEFGVVTRDIENKLVSACRSHGSLITRSLLAAEPSLPQLLRKLAPPPQEGPLESYDSDNATTIEQRILEELSNEESVSVPIFASGVRRGLEANHIDELGPAWGCQRRPSVAETARPPPATAGVEEAPPSTAVSIVSSIFPDMDRALIETCLAFYQGDVDQLTEALLDHNLPPHLQERVNDSAGRKPLTVSDDHHSPDAATDAAPPPPTVEQSVYTLLATAPFTVPTAEAALDDRGDPTTTLFTSRAAAAPFDPFALDDELKARIIAACDVYDDESDDAEFGGNTYVADRAVTPGDDDPRSDASGRVSGAALPAANADESNGQQSVHVPRPSPTSRTYQAKPKTKAPRRTHAATAKATHRRRLND